MCYESFRDVCIKNYRLDPAWYFTAPGLAWDAALKLTNVELELLATNFIKFHPDNPYLVQKCGSYLPYKPSYCQFCVQITVVGYHGNKSQSGVNLKETVRLVDPENPQFGANSVHVLYL